MMAITALMTSSMIVRAVIIVVVVTPLTTPISPLAAMQSKVIPRCNSIGGTQGAGA
jgi:hypothetical protein